MNKFAIISGPAAPKVKDVLGNEVKKIRPYLDGLHCFDEICTNLQMSDKDVTSALRGHVTQIIHR